MGRKLKYIRITIEEYNTLAEKARRWDDYIERVAKYLPNSKRTPEERKEAARKAVNARWKKYRENKEKHQKTLDK